MANLTPKENELLAVVKYYTSQRDNVAKLMGKLSSVPGGDHSISEIVEMTGLTETEVRAMVNWCLTPGRKPKFSTTLTKSDAVKKFEEVSREYDKFKSELSEAPVEEKKPRKRIAPARKPVEKKPEPRFNTETLPGRIAQEMFEMIQIGMRRGDQFYTQIELMQKCEIGKRTAGRVLELLREDDLIEYADPLNPRKGYVVK